MVMKDGSKRPWWSAHQLWIGLTFLGYIGLIAALMIAGRGEKWPEATTAYFAIAAFAVLWSYAASTRAVLESSRHQVQLGQWQAAHANRMFRISHKPFVVVERVQDSLGRGYHYYLRNIGPGLAVNVWIVEDNSDGGPRKSSLGALGPGDSRILSGELEGWLCNQPGTRPFVLLAEALVTRTAQWTATIGWRDREPGTEIQSQLVKIDVTRRARSIDQVLADNWPTIQRGLRDAASGQ